jgi:hypothetical protein
MLLSLMLNHSGKQKLVDSGLRSGGRSPLGDFYRITPFASKILRGASPPAKITGFIE